MPDRKYPSILELALKAGKWSVIAGSGAAIIASAGCSGVGNNNPDSRLTDVDAGQDYILGGDDVRVPDVPGLDVQDAGQDNELPGAFADVVPEIDADAETDLPSQDFIEYELAGDDPGRSFDADADVIEVVDVVDVPLPDAGAFEDLPDAGVDDVITPDIIRSDELAE